MIQVGSVLRDNDKRNDDVVAERPGELESGSEARLYPLIVRKGRTVTVTAIEHEGDVSFAVYQSNTRKARVRFDRIHTDGQPHSNGWSLVSL